MVYKGLYNPYHPLQEPEKSIDFINSHICFSLFLPEILREIFIAPNQPAPGYDAPNTLGSRLVGSQGSIGIHATQAKKGGPATLLETFKGIIVFLEPLYGCFQKFILENPIKIDDLGVPLFLETLYPKRDLFFFRFHGLLEGNNSSVSLTIELGEIFR